MVTSFQGYLVSLLLWARQPLRAADSRKRPSLREASFQHGSRRLRGKSSKVLGKGRSGDVRGLPLAQTQGQTGHRFRGRRVAMWLVFPAPHRLRLDGATCWIKLRAGEP